MALARKLEVEYGLNRDEAYFATHSVKMYDFNQPGLAQLNDFYHKTYREGVIARRRSRRSNSCLSPP
jgi:hypothetical protein